MLVIVEISILTMYGSAMFSSYTYICCLSFSVPSMVRSASESSYLEFEAKSARDGAW